MDKESLESLEADKRRAEREKFMNTYDFDQELADNPQPFEEYLLHEKRHEPKEDEARSRDGEQRRD